MKIPLAYQRSEYDCGPTALLNAISFLFTREEMPPELIKYTMMYTLDSYNESGEACKSGTSQMAMMFLSSWLNQYARSKQLPISSEFISGENVQINENSRIISALQQGGAVVLRVFYDCGHYVTLTGISDNQILLFDPYFRKRPFKEQGIIMLDKPFSANRSVDFDVFYRGGKHPYTLEGYDKREAVIIYNTQTQKTAENTIEYFL